MGVAHEIIEDLNLNPDEVMLGQGTLRPDLIESASGLASGQVNIHTFFFVKSISPMPLIVLVKLIYKKVFNFQWFVKYICQKCTVFDIHKSIDNEMIVIFCKKLLIFSWIFEDAFTL